MIKFAEAFDTNAEEVFLNGISSIEEIAPNTVRVSFFAKRRDNHSGSEERTILTHQLWNTAELAEAANMIGWAICEGIAPDKRRTPTVVAAGMH